ncbi:MAG: acetyl-CoA carboxylase biotin carboxyl carrier protein subunit, partial [Paracoccaceae bacterium]
NEVLAPMPGVVKAVFARRGDRVKNGERLAILEAMKMEHTLVAPRDGMIAELLVKEGEQVAAGTALITLKEKTS